MHTKLIHFSKSSEEPPEMHEMWNSFQFKMNLFFLNILNQCSLQQLL